VQVTRARCQVPVVRAAGRGWTQFDSERGPATGLLTESRRGEARACLSVRRRLATLAVGIGVLTALVPIASQAHRLHKLPVKQRPLTVSAVHSRCLRHPRFDGMMKIRGFYVRYPFFGPGPPATPITYETGYLFGHRMPPLLQPSDLGSGVLVKGPDLASSRLIPDTGWISVHGNLHCARLSPVVQLRTWRSLAASTRGAREATARAQGRP
jgi:hypothetical protein